MVVFIAKLFVCIIFLILCIFLTVKAYKRKKKTEKFVTVSNRKKRNSNNRKKDNYTLYLSFCGTILSILGIMFTLFESVPIPTIYPLDNEARVYTESTEAIISTINFPGFSTYYSLDGSDPENGYIYEEPIIITKTTTVSAKTKFLIFWSKLEKNTFRFESTQNITISQTNDEHTSIQDIFTYALVFLIFCAIFIPVIRGDK